MTSYVKLIRKDRTHNGLLLREGLNCFKQGEKFNTCEGPCGLYFYKEEDIDCWFDMCDTRCESNHLGFVATVTLCPDSKVVTKGRMLQTDKFVLGPFQTVEEYWTPEKALAAVQRNGLILQFIPERLKSPEVCRAAVHRHAYALQFTPTEIMTGFFGVYRI